MLSILIPIYNYPVYSLVSKLSSLALKEGINFEILCIDDASTEFTEENKQISTIPGVTLETLAQNIGRSALRNLLASKASNKNLLFIDTDMSIPNDHYLSSYLNAIDHCDIIYGGLEYEKTVKSTKHVLRWKYGNKREAIRPEVRDEEKYFSVKTCNLFIKKHVFDKVKFNENIREYGHEDTLFCIELQRHQFKVLHVYNPVIHLGVERSDIYLNKVDVACKNLAKIASEYLSSEEKDQVRLIYFYRRLNKMGLMPIVNLAYKVLENRILRNLLSENPSLLYLDVFKLISYTKASKK